MAKLALVLLGFCIRACVATCAAIIQPMNVSGPGRFSGLFSGPGLPSAFDVKTSAVSAELQRLGHHLQRSTGGPSVRAVCSAEP